jgi:hypothetical protein
MSWLIKAWGWCRDHAWIIAIVAVGILLLILSRGKFDFKKFYSKEKEVIDAKAEARKAQIELGAAKAAEKIKEEHKEVIKKLDEQQAKRAKELENDPEKLVEAILRATLVLLLFLLPWTAPSVAFGADDLVTIELPGGLKKKCHAGDPQKCAAFLPEGVVAPFAGVLQTPRQAAELAAKAEFTDERIKAAADVEIRLAKNEIEKLKAIHAVELKAEVDKRLAAEKALEDAGPAFYEHPVFVAAVAVVATVAVTAVAIKGAQELRE